MSLCGNTTLFGNASDPEKSRRFELSVEDDTRESLGGFRQVVECRLNGFCRLLAQLHLDVL